MSAEESKGQTPAAPGSVRDGREAENIGHSSSSAKISSSAVVKNFRQAASLPRIYRCASTDGLADVVVLVVESSSSLDGHKGLPAETLPLRRDDEEESEAERVLLRRAGLIIDLRSPSERDDVRARIWTEGAPGGRIVSRDFVRSDDDDSDDEGQEMRILPKYGGRMLLRIDVLSPSRLMRHLTQHWMSKSQRDLSDRLSRAAAASVRSGSREDENELRDIRMKVLNGRGLPGLYEAVVQTSGGELCAALRALTEYFESVDRDGRMDGAAVVHCVQGKDRTGLVIMLCQSIIGLSDDEIIADYVLSDRTGRQNGHSGSAAADTLAPRSSPAGIDWNVFAGAPREAMEATLRMIREKYGSVSPGYLDAIGFGEQLRRRFLTAVVGRNGQYSALSGL